MSIMNTKYITDLEGLLLAYNYHSKPTYCMPHGSFQCRLAPWGSETGANNRFKNYLCDFEGILYPKLWIQDDSIGSDL